MSAINDTEAADTLTDIKSSMLLEDWRVDLTIFNGFYDTRPKYEYTKRTWSETLSIVAITTGPAINENKELSEYYILSTLKEAEFIGTTRAKAINNGNLPYGKQRSSNHVTESTAIVIDIDGATHEQINQIRDNLLSSEITHLIYSTHSHGRKDKPGYRCRLIVPVDQPLDKEKYKLAAEGIANFLEADNGENIIDRSGFSLHQQQGTWCTSHSRSDDAFRIVVEGSIASSQALIALSAQNTHRSTPTVHDEPKERFDENRVNDAMIWISMCTYDDWLKAAMWLKSAYGDTAKNIWVSRSDPNGKYKPEEFWDELTPRIKPKAGAGMIFRTARDNAANALITCCRAGTWDENGIAAIVYLKKYHKRFYSERFNEVA